MIDQRHRRDGGFIVTFELILIFTLVVLATLVALAALRNALVDAGLFLRPSLVFDSSAPDARLVGKVFDFDGSETPRVRRRDPNNGLALVLGVRRDRFTTRTPVFYAADDCTGAPYVHDPSVLDGALGFPPKDPLVEGRFGSFDELQGAVYAVGVGGPIVPGSPFGPGILLRNDPGALPGAPLVESVYYSDWQAADGLAPGAPPPSVSLVSALNPCRDVAGALDGLVAAVEVTDPATAANVLAPFTPPFRVR